MAMGIFFSRERDHSKLEKFRSVLWMFPVAVGLHNGEEAVFLPGFIAAHGGQLPWHPKAGAIWVGLLAATLAALVVTVQSARRGKQSIWAYLLFGYAAAMLINVFVPHVPATLIFGHYTPGVVTAVLINLPVMSVLLYLAARDGWVSGVRAVGYGLLVPVVAAGLIFGWFGLGGFWFAASPPNN